MPDIARSAAVIMATVVLASTGLATVGTPASADPSSYSFLGNSGPVRWDPCRTINYRVNPSQMPTGGMSDTQEALTRISSASGLRYSYLGTTSVVPGNDPIPADSPLVISWVKPGQTPYLGSGSQSAGVAGVKWGRAFRSDGAQTTMIVEGWVTMNADRPLPAGFTPVNGGGTHGILMQHELGHTVGMGHVDDRAQMMNSTVYASDWGDGDLAGLNLLGSSQGCLYSTPPTNPTTSPSPTTEPTPGPDASTESDVAPAPKRGPGVTRLAGPDRFSTAAEVSQGSFPGTANDVFIVTGTNWPDALSAGPAAAKVNAPVLPVQTSGIPDAIKDELTRLQPRRAWVVGGATAVDGSVIQALESRGIEVTRISGASRYETASAVAARFFPDAAGAYYASGGGYADALGGGAAAAKRGWPLLLTAKDSLPSSTPKIGKDRIVLGGTAAVSEHVRAQLGARRVAGPDRFSTAVAISRDAFSRTAVAYLATGLNFPDALSGAAAAARDNAPLMLAAGDCVSTGTKDAFSDLGVESRVVLGGNAVVSDRAADLTSC